MAFEDITDPSAVQRALDEFNRIGRVPFLEKYGFGKARGWVILDDQGREYDSKAVLGAAHGYQFPESGPMTPYDFYGGEPTASKLRAMGFEVREPENLKRNPVWSRDELILALDLYLRRRPAFPNDQDPEVIELSRFLGRLASISDTAGTERFRNANGVAMKLQNLRRFDPAEEGKGLPGGGRGEAEVWQTFAGDQARLTAAVEAIRAVVDAAQEEPQLLEDNFEGEEAEEGRVLTRLHRFRERDRKIVERCKAKALADHKALRCEACDFDFAQHYGERGNGFIECHHTRPVSALLPGEKTKLDELALLCANCHRMIHVRRPWLSVDELRSAMRGSRRN